MSSESLKSLIVTDPDLVDPEIDVSGLRTQTDTDPRLLASIADFPGISYDPTQFSYLTDLNELFAYGLPMIDTDSTTPPADGGAGGGGTGNGGQATLPGTIDSIITPPDMSFGINRPEEQRLIDAGIGVQGAPGDPVVAPGEIPVTQEEIDEFNRRPVTPVSPSGQPIDPTGMLPQTSTPFMVEGALGVDPREKMDFVTEEDLADNTNLLQRLGLPADFDLKKAVLDAGINLAVGVPISLIVRGLEAVLPDRDPRQTALEELYDVQDGTIQSGLMKGYNPVSGNPLDPTYGLQEAYQDRIDTIENTLKTKYNMTDAEIADVKAGSYTGDVDTNLFKTLTDLEDAKEKEKNVLDLYSGDIDERDQMLEDISLQNRAQAEADAIRLKNLTGDVDFDTTGVNPFKDIDTGVGEFDTTLTKQLTSTDLPYDAEFEDMADVENIGLSSRADINTTDKFIVPFEGARTVIENPNYIEPGGTILEDDFESLVDTKPDQTVTEEKPVDIELADNRAVRELDSDQIIEYENLTNQLEGQEMQRTGNPDISISKQEEIKNKAIDQIQDQDIIDRGGGDDIGTGGLDPNRGQQVDRGSSGAGDNQPVSTTTGPPSTGFQPQSTYDAELEDERDVGGGGNDGGGNGGGGKIVCTMMNESYGFGSFRNKIWMKFHKDLSPEYQKGYHKLFLPLVRIAKKNIIVKKILEHIAVHSTIDMRQSMRGKTHLLGRIYRKILLPLCYWVGKNG